LATGISKPHLLSGALRSTGWRVRCEVDLQAWQRSGVNAGSYARANAGLSGSTMMIWASCSLIARRALHTWQMKFVWLVSNLMIWSSPRPSSRNRFWTSGAVQSRLIRTATPAWIRLSGQTSQRASAEAPGSDIFDQLIFAALNVMFSFPGNYTSIAISLT
jgi:hypothetical protein